jgi:HlyD family secretion protein
VLRTEARGEIIMKKIIILLGCLTLVLAACGSAPTTATPTAEAVQVKTTNLATAAEGKLEPAQNVTLNFTSGGLVTEVNVKEGQAVKAGDVIARVKSDAQRDALAQAEAALAVAQANQTAYRTQLPQLIAGAEADVKSAQAQQAGAAAGRDVQAEIIDAESALAQAKYAQQQAQTALDMMYQYNKTGTNLQRVKLAFDNAVKATQAAEAHLKALKSGSPSDRATGAEIVAGKAGEAAAQARLDQLIAERDGKATDSFEAAIQQAQAAVDSAQVALAQTELRAPVAGTIAQLNLKVGELTPRDQAGVVLADLSGWQIETDDVTEIKVPTIKVGQNVTIRFDALPDAELKGEVESISDVAQNKSGDVVYPVKIKVLDNDPRLRWGMTAAVTFGNGE